MLPTKASNHARIKQAPQQQQATSTKSKTRLFSVHTSAHNKQQACKHHCDNGTGRSHCQEPTEGIISAATAMTSTKSRARLFSQHTTKKQPQQATSNNQQPTSTMVPEDLTAKNQDKA